MGPGTHPPYGPVAYRDRTTGEMFLTRSTLAGKPGLRTEEIDGVSYTVVDADVTSASHPFWTGRKTALDTEGRIEAFRRRYGGSR